MSTADLALLAACAAIIAMGVVAVVTIRGRRASERRLTVGLIDVESRMDALARELVTTVERVREDALRARILESLGQALDLDEVLARCAEAAASLPGVAGAIASLQADGVDLSASAGAGDGFAASRAPRADVIGAPPDDGAVRAIGISYHYAADRAAPGALRSAVAVPLESASGRIGFLTVFGRSEEPPVADTDFATLEAIARHAGPALDAARRRGNPRRVAPETDRLTGLGSRQALHETLAVEVARSLRRGDKLALCSFDLDDFRRTNLRLGQIDGDTVLVEVAKLIRESIRPADLAYRSGGDEFVVIMPGAGRIEGEALFARIQAGLRRATGTLAAGLTLSAGIAELTAEDDGVSLFERADRALRRAKEAGKGTAA